jgi:uncharacterized protein (TIRG00374 family)
MRRIQVRLYRTSVAPGTVVPEPEPLRAGRPAQFVPHPSPARAPLRRWYRRRPARVALHLVILVLVIRFLALPALSRGGTHWRVLLDIDSGWVAAAVAAEFCSLFAFAMATWTMLQPSTRLPIWRMLRIDLSAVALSHSMPAGGAAGTALGLRLLTEDGVPLSDAAFAKLGQGVLSAVLLQVGLAAGVVVAVTTGHGSSISAISLAAAIPTCITLAVAAVLLRRRPSWLAAIAERVITVLPRARPGRAAAAVDLAGTHLDALLVDRGRLTQAVGWTSVNWIADAAALWCALRAYGVAVPVPLLLIAFGLASTAKWIPLTPGGLGVVEAVLVPLVVAFGAPAPVAVLGIVTWRLASFWLPIVLGAGAYTSIRIGRLSRRPAPLGAG